MARTPVEVPTAGAGSAALEGVRSDSVPVPVAGFGKPSRDAVKGKGSFSKLELSPREFSRATGIPVYRVRRMVETGGIAADRSTARITIPRSEVERLAGREMPVTAREEIRAEIRQAITDIVREELPGALIEALGRMAKGGA